MNWAQTINTLIFVFGTAFGVFGSIHLANLQKQKMPDQIAARLEQFAHMAVGKVEQQNKDLSDAAKKQLAITEAMKLFQYFKLPAPTYGAVDTAIESAMFLLPKDNSPTS